MKSEILSGWEVVCIIEALKKFEGAHEEHKQKLIDKVENAKDVKIIFKKK